MVVTGSSDPTARSGRLAQKSDLTGLAFSGGGIRSAAFCLGVLQGLDSLSEPDEPQVLDGIDYLSAVSGGSYIGTSLAAGMMQPGYTFPFDSKIGDQETKEMQHLRDYSNFLVPNGFFDYLISAVSICRGLLINAVVILPVLLFAAACGAGSITAEVRTEF
jgi:predicted acylesterase/phospholipase RssA